MYPVDFETEYDLSEYWFFHVRSQFFVYFVLPTSLHKSISFLLCPAPNFPRSGPLKKKLITSAVCATNKLTTHDLSFISENNVSSNCARTDNYPLLVYRFFSLLGNPSNSDFLEINE